MISETFTLCGAKLELQSTVLCPQGSEQKSLLLVLNTRSRDVLIISAVSRNLFGLERLQ